MAFREAPEFDAGIALAAFVSLLLNPVLSGEELSVPGMVLAAVTALPLILRRRYPVGVLTVVVAGGFGCLAVFKPDQAAVGVTMVAIYTVGAQGRRLRSLLIGAAMAPLVATAVAIASRHGFQLDEMVTYLALVLVALAVGDARRGRLALARAAAAGPQGRGPAPRLGHRPGARDPRPHRRRADQRGNRRPPGDKPADHQVTRLAHPRLRKRSCHSGASATAVIEPTNHDAQTGQIRVETLPVMHSFAVWDKRQAGPATIIGLAAGYAALWFAARPAGQPSISYVGQFLGAECVLLLSVGLVLISTLPWVEIWFDGIDRAAIWHRRVAIAGLALLVPHILLAANPHKSSLGPPLAFIGAAGLYILLVWAVLPRWRAMIPGALHALVLGLRDWPGIRQLRTAVGGYERWRVVHRTTGLFVAAGVAHGLLDGTPFPHAPLLRWTFVAIGGIGLAFYLYRELLARHFVPLADYQVESVAAIGPGLIEIALAPLGRPVAFTPGQFAMLFLEAKDGWHRHPFTIASAPAERVLRFAIKELGDDTTGLGDFLQPGMPAVIGGPFGRFSHRKAAGPQVWIAGGIGITPFLSWLRALDDHPPHGQVDFFYTSAGPDKPYADEITELTGRNDMVRVHFIDSTSEGHLTADRVISAAGGSPGELSVFLCGPTGMVRSLQSDLHSAGVPTRHIHHEYFDLR